MTRFPKRAETGVSRPSRATDCFCGSSPNTVEFGRRNSATNHSRPAKSSGPRQTVQWRYRNGRAPLSCDKLLTGVPLERRAKRSLQDDASKDVGFASSLNAFCRERATRGPFPRPRRRMSGSSRPRARGGKLRQRAWVKPQCCRGFHRLLSVHQRAGIASTRRRIRREVARSREKPREILPAVPTQQHL
jgi:hypothetical protein